MANIKSQIKRNKQNEKLRAKNSRVKASIRTASKKVIKAVESKMNADELKEMYRAFVSIVDRAAGNRIIHKKTADRKKSRIAKRVNSSLKSQS